MDFEPLYSGNRVWYLRVSDCMIIRKYGVLGGTLTTSVKQITSGKNIGKKNETTPFEQACLEAKALYKKQLDSGYSTEQGKPNNQPPKPMLAHGYDKQAHKIIFPAMVQPKLDGVRMLLGPDGTCLSRTGKKFSAEVLGHIVKEHDKTDRWLDGELYSDELTFEEIVSACRKQSGAPNTAVYYHVYDIIDPKKPFCDRLAELKDLSKGLRFTRFVKTLTVENHEQVLENHDNFVQEGYEGIMIRNTDSKYEADKRSYHLQKFKNFQDDEFFIVDIKEATGNDSGTAIVQCKNNQGDTFWVRPRGTREYRAEILKQKDLFQGQLLTVRYQNLTDKGIPRFPVGIAVRNYE